jgi:hypothetical protein
MDISSTYTVADQMPEVFRIEIWQDERLHYNRTAAEAYAIKKLFESLGPNYTVGVVAALPDAMHGAAAPALPLELLVAAGYGGAKLNYAFDLVSHFGGGRWVIPSSVGAMWNVLDGPQGSMSERCASALVEVLPGRAKSELLMSIEGVANGAEEFCAKLLKPFLLKVQ